MQHMKKLLRASILLMVIIATGLSLQAQDTTGKAISPAQFEKRAHKRKVTVLDVRTPQEYAEGHLKNAVLINVMDSAAFVSRVQGLKKNRTYLLYCRSGRRAQLAADVLAEAGFERLSLLEGDFLGWAAQGLPTEVPAPTATSNAAAAP